MNYSTEYVFNLSTGQSFQFDVPQEKLLRLQQRKEIIATGQPHTLGSLKELATIYEFSFFPAYNKVLQIWTENGYTDELVTQILEEFGVPKNFIPKLLNDHEFVDKIRPWFEGITRDGGRASRTLFIVYKAVEKFFST